MSYETRRTKLLEAVAHEEAALMVHDPKNVFYLTGFFSDPHERFMALFYHRAKGWALILPLLDVEAAKQKVETGIEVIGYGDHQSPEQVVTNWLSEANVTDIYIEELFISFARVKWLLAYRQEIQLHNLTPYLQRLRLVKTPEEISALMKAGETTDRVLEAALAQLKAGMTEIELAAELEYQGKKHGSEVMSFGTCVLYGAKSALPHGKPGQIKLEPGGLLLIDFGLVMDAYCSDMTRTFHLGEWGAEAQKIYDIVLQAETAALEAAKPGMTFEALDQIARDIIREAGYGDYFIHRLGHGMGIDVHEYPSVGAGNTETIEAGMVFTIEPGIYLPKLGGVRIEDAVYMTEQGAETLTSFPKDREHVLLAL
jgi:Xaa-Pro dipeptidase